MHTARQDRRLRPTRHTRGEIRIFRTGRCLRGLGQGPMGVTRKGRWPSRSQIASRVASGVATRGTGVSGETGGDAGSVFGLFRPAPWAGGCLNCAAAPHILRRMAPADPVGRFFFFFSLPMKPRPQSHPPPPNNGPTVGWPLRPVLAVAPFERQERRRGQKLPAELRPGRKAPDSRTGVLQG